MDTCILAVLRRNPLCPHFSKRITLTEHSRGVSNVGLCCAVQQNNLLDGLKLAPCLLLKGALMQVPVLDG